MEEGFRKADDHLEIPHAAHLRERPLRLLLAFAVAQDHDVPLSRTARRLVRENLHLVDDAFRARPGGDGGVPAHPRLAAARDAHADGDERDRACSARYLPEWEHIVCRWQHVIYHTYTVDVHSIFLVEELRRLWKGKYERALPELTELMRGARGSARCSTSAACCTTSARAAGGDHSRRGRRAGAHAASSGSASPRSAASACSSSSRHHLTMSHVAQRRDLSDPKVIVEFARVVGDRENLRNLYLATFADMRASSSTAWTEWRGELLRELFERTAEFLETGDDDRSAAATLAIERVERGKDAARDELRALGVAEASIDRFFEMMPRRYFVSHAPQQIARHALVLFSLRPGASGFATSVRELRGELLRADRLARGQHGLYADVAGALTARGINIIGSHVYTTRTGLALEIYRVATPPGAHGRSPRALGSGSSDALRRRCSRATCASRS